jgi:hypothetical protein
MPALAAATLLTACADTTTGAEQRGGGTTASFPRDAHALGALLVRGARATHTAHITLRFASGGTTISGSGDEKLSGGKLTAMDLTETVAGNRLRFRVLGRTMYANLPPALFPATKPWVQIDASTQDPPLQQLYTSVRSATQMSGGQQARLFVSVARNLRFEGTQHFDGDTVGRYALTVNIASLPADFPNRDALQASGVAKIPIQLYVDGSGRARMVSEKFSVAGHRFTASTRATKINAPVSITAPPRDQVEVK